MFALSSATVFHCMRFDRLKHTISNSTETLWTHWLYWE